MTTTRFHTVRRDADRTDGLDHDAADELADEIRAGAPGIDVAAAIESGVRHRLPFGSDTERARLADAVLTRVSGMDRLAPLLADPSVDEVFVGNGTVWVERAGRVERIGSIPDGAAARVIERVLTPLGRRLDRTSPIVDARLPDGSRVCAVVAPVALDGPTLSIRRFGDRTRTVADFVGVDATTDGGCALAERCRQLVELRCNVIVSGATSSGKTSLLAALIELTDPHDRLVVIEDVAELPCAHPHRIRLEARPATIDGPPAIDAERLVRTALRLRPDRIVVGEARG
ncbi:MAG: ATPase, T2SS/T4P/T4SS family, partial [Actinomycetota bacterium]